MRAWSCLIAAAAPLLAWCFSHQGGLRAADNASYGQLLRAWPLPARDDILIVAVDDASLGELGRWPWRRTLHAALLERIAADSPRAVLLDFFFSEPSAETADDLALAKAMRDLQVYLPSVFVPALHGTAARQAPPVPVLAESAKAVGHVNANPDADGVVRRIQRWDGPTTAAQRYVVDQMVSDAMAGLEAPPRPDVDWPGPGPLLAFAGPPGSYRTVSYAAVLRGEVPVGGFSNRFVLVGATSAGLGDQFAVPTAGAGGTMAGVEIHANALATLLTRASPVALEDAAWPWQVAWLVVPSGMLLAALMRVRRPALALLVCTGTLSLVSISAFSLLRVWLPPAATLLAALLTYLLWTWQESAQLWRYFERRVAETRRPSASRLAFELPAAGRHQATVEPASALLRRAGAMDQLLARLRAVEDLLARTLEGLDVAVLVCRQDGRIVLANAAAHQLLGRNRTQARSGAQDKLIGQDLSSVMAVRASPARPALGSVPAEGSGPAAWRGRVLTTPAGRIFRVDTAAALDGVQTDIGLQTAILHEQTEEYRRSEQLDQWLGFLSHDLRSPQNSIVHALSLHERLWGTDDERSRALHARIRQEVDRTVHLADSLIDLTTAQSGVYRYRSVEMGNLLIDAIGQVEAQAELRHIQLEEQFSDGECLVMADVALVTRALVNLLANAIRHSSDRGRIRICLGGDADTGHAVCAIADEGEGMASEQCGGLFSSPAFARAAPLAAAGIGRRHGVGLAIVQTVVTHHGGWLDVDSAPGVGSRFWIALPLVQAGSPVDPS